MADLEQQLDDRVLLLTLARPERLNALSNDLLSELQAVLREQATSRACHSIVITGAGRGFCSGADLKPDSDTNYWRERDVARVWESQRRFSATTEIIRGLPQPVIAAVNGPAAGAGFALAACCDLRYASASATFSAAFVHIGLSGCDLGLSWYLPRIVGVGAAHELMLTGRTMAADEALERGLVLEVVPDGEVVERALLTARFIAARPFMAVSMTKQVMWAAVEASPLTAALELENRTQVLLAQTDEYVKALDTALSRKAEIQKGGGRDRAS